MGESATTAALTTSITTTASLSNGNCGGANVFNAINAQPDIHRNFTAMLSHFLGIVHTMYERCRLSLEVRFKDETGKRITKNGSSSRQHRRISVISSESAVHLVAATPTVATNFIALVILGDTNGGSGCISLFEHLLDTRVYPSGGQDVYFRADTVELAKYHSSKGLRGNKKLEAVFITLIVLTFTLLIFFLFYWLHQKKKRGSYRTSQIPTSVRKIFGSSFKECC